MPATIDYLVKQCAIVLNASTGVGTGDSATIGVTDDPKSRPYAFLSNIAIDSDAEVCDTLCSTKEHPLLSASGFIVATNGLADNAIIAVPSGATVYAVYEPIQIDGIDGRVKPVTFINRRKAGADPLSRTTIDKYYALPGRGVIRHNGTAAICTVVAFKKSSAPQAPDALNNSTISCMLAMATAKMDTWLSMAGYFANQWQLRRRAIIEGSHLADMVAPYQGQAAA